MKHQFNLPDMSCGHCVAAITQALQEADPTAAVDIDRERKSATVDSHLSRDVLSDVLTQAGYPPEQPAA